MTHLDKAVGKIRKSLENHRVRHRPSGFGMALADSIHYVDGSAWDDLTAGASLFLSRPYLGAVEEACPENLEPRYALIFQGLEAVAAVAAQRVRIQAARLPQKTPAAAKVPLEKLEERVLVCGNVLSWGPHGVAFAPHVAPRAVWPAVAEALYRLRRADRLLGKTDLVLVKDLPEEMPGAEALEPFSYRPLETEPDMVLDIDPAWQSFEDYLASLTSKYRKTAKKVVKSLKRAGLVVEKLDDVESHAATLHALYLEVHEQQKLRLATLSPEFLPTLASRLGEAMSTIVVRRESEILGFVTTLRDGETTVGYYIGYRREANREAPIYLRLLQAVVGDAIERRSRRLSLGRSALEPKARLGARPVPLRVWIRHRVPAVNLLVRALLRVVEHDEAPERNPFASGPTLYSS